MKERPNIQPSLERHRLVVPVIVLDDDEFGGLHRRGVVKLWGDEQKPSPETVANVLSQVRAMHNGDKPVDIGEDVISITPLVVEQRLRRLPPIARSLFRLIGKDWVDTSTTFLPKEDYVTQCFSINQNFNDVPASGHFSRNLRSK